MKNASNRIAVEVKFVVHPAGNTRFAARLQQTQLTGTCDRFGTPLDLKFAKDIPVVPFHSTQGEEKPLAHLLI